MKYIELYANEMEVNIDITSPVSVCINCRINVDNFKKSPDDLVCIEASCQARLNSANLSTDDSSVIQVALKLCHAFKEKEAILWQDI